MRGAGWGGRQRGQPQGACCLAGASTCGAVTVARGKTGGRWRKAPPAAPPPLGAPLRRTHKWEPAFQRQTGRQVGWCSGGAPAGRCAQGCGSWGGWGCGCSVGLRRAGAGNERTANGGGRGRTERVSFLLGRSSCQTGPPTGRTSSPPDRTPLPRRIGDGPQMPLWVGGLVGRQGRSRTSGIGRLGPNLDRGKAVLSSGVGWRYNVAGTWVRRRASSSDVRATDVLSAQKRGACEAFWRAQTMLILF